MQPSETAELLTYIAAFDRRTIGKADVLAWHEIIGHLELMDCKQAVTAHFRESTDYLMPAHVVRLARNIADTRRNRETIAALPRGKGVPMPDEVREMLKEFGKAKEDEK